MEKEGNLHRREFLEDSRVTPGVTEWKRLKSLTAKELLKLGKYVSVSEAELQWKIYGSIQTKELLHWKKHAPIGYRFDPTEDQLLRFYLLAKINGTFVLPGIVEDVDVYQCHPASLPGMNKEEAFSYFFTPRERRYRGGKTVSRTTKDGRGTWKLSGQKTRLCDVDNSDLGEKNTLFYNERGGPSDEDVKTKWIMHEYVLDESLFNLIQLPSTSSNTKKTKDIAVCRIYLRKKDEEE